MEIKTRMVEAHLVAIEKGEIEFLLIKRAEKEIYPNIWQMVTGKIEEGETAYQAALREIKEETGLEVKEMWTVPNVNSFYSPNDDSIIFIPVFLALVNKKEVKLSEEHSDFKWVDSEKAIELLPWPGQKNSVRIIKEFLDGNKKYSEFLRIKLNTDS